MCNIYSLALSPSLCLFDILSTFSLFAATLIFSGGSIVLP